MEVPPDLSPSGADPFAVSSSLSPEGGSADSPPLSDDRDSDPILKFITQMLMEENADENIAVVQDSLALQATEESLNEVLGGIVPPPTNQPSLDANHSTLGLDDIFSRRSADYGSSGPVTSSSTSTSNSTDHQWLGYLEDYHSSVLETPHPGEQMFHSANGLEARLAGTGTAAQSFHNSLASKRTSVVDVLEAYHLYLSICPFKKFAIGLINKVILDLVEKATTIHIVDFGIGHGFHWPMLVQHLLWIS